MSEPHAVRRVRPPPPAVKSWLQNMVPNGLHAIDLTEVLTSNTSSCAHAPAPSISCAARLIPRLAEAVAHQRPKHRDTLLQSASTYRASLLWQRSRILSEMGNHDLNRLRVGTIGDEFHELLRDLGLNPIAMRTQGEPRSALTDHPRFEVLLYPEKQAPTNCGAVASYCFALKRMPADPSVNAYTQVTGYNLKQALEAVRRVDHARRQRRAESSNP